MSAREMQIEFERLIQLVNPEFIIDNKLDSDTIFNFINIAQERYMKSIYVQISSTDKESNEYKRLLESCKSLIVSKSLTDVSPSEGYQFSVKFTLPNTIDEKFFLYLKSHSVLSNSVIIPNVLITHSDIDKLVPSKYNNPILRNPLVLLEGDSIQVIHDRDTTGIESCFLTYIRKPKDVNTIEQFTTEVVSTTKCELSESACRDVIAMAVDIFVREGAYKLMTKQDNK